MDRTSTTRGDAFGAWRWSPATYSSWPRIRQGLPQPFVESAVTEEQLESPSDVQETPGLDDVERQQVQRERERADRERQRGCARLARDVRPKH